MPEGVIETVVYTRRHEYWARLMEHAQPVGLKDHCGADWWPYRGAIGRVEATRESGGERFALILGYWWPETDFEAIGQALPYSGLCGVIRRLRR
jgi:hypothetical protein